MDVTPHSAAATPYSGQDISLNDMFDLLAQEVERLQASLEFYRLSEHPEKNDLIRWHVRQIDARQDRLDEIKALLLLRGEGRIH